MNKHDIMNFDLIGKGYMTRRIVTNEQGQPTCIMETLYWVNPENGNVWKSPEKIISHNFHVRGMVWELVESLPEVCEFIGNYHGPVGCN